MRPQPVAQEQAMKDQDRPTTQPPHEQPKRAPKGGPIGVESFTGSDANVGMPKPPKAVEDKEQRSPPEPKRKP
jgi:hypothetical protein